MSGQFQKEVKFLIWILLGPIVFGLAGTLIFVNLRTNQNSSSEHSLDTDTSNPTYADPPSEPLIEEPTSQRSGNATAPAAKSPPSVEGETSAGFLVGEWGPPLGLNVNDRILEIDGVTVDDEELGRALLESLKDKKKFSLTLLRDGNTVTYNYNLN